MRAKAEAEHLAVLDPPVQKDPAKHLWHATWPMHLTSSRIAVIALVVATSESIRAHLAHKL